MDSASEISGLRNEFGDRDGYLGRAFLSAVPFPAKQVELRNGWIVWKEHARERFDALRADQYKLPGPDLLEDFLRLGNANDLAVKDFVSKWGGLVVCERHWLPAPHDPFFVGRCTKCQSSLNDPACDGWPRIELLRDGGDRIFDPVGAYRFYSQLALRLLEIGKAIKNRRTLSDANWELPAGRASFLRATGPITGLSDVERFAWYLDCWLILSQVRPRVVSRRKKLAVEFEGSRVFGAIGFQLIATITGSTELAVCSECSRPFLSRKRAPKGRHRYCEDCGRAAAVRNAVARYYARNRVQVLKRRKLRREEASRKLR
jgi:hypothetical protein